MTDLNEENLSNKENIDSSQIDDVQYEDDNLADTIKKLKDKIKQLEQEKSDILTSWQKDKAEFVNARRRDEESKIEFMKFSKQGVIEDIIPVLDSFDMAMLTDVWNNVSEEWRKGVQNIYTQLLNALSKHDVAPYTLIGDIFDPNLHHSIATVATEDKSNDHKISEVLQKGYRMSGKVIRPALVKVFEA